MYYVCMFKIVSFVCWNRWLNLVKLICIMYVCSQIVNCWNKSRYVDLLGPVM